MNHEKPKNCAGDLANLFFSHPTWKGAERGGHNAETFYPFAKLRKENEYVYMHVCDTYTHIYTQIPSETLFYI